MIEDRENLRAKKNAKKKHKFGASKTVHAGFSFASKLEAAVYNILHLQKLAGEIREIQVQHSIYMTKANIQYIADFKCIKSDGSHFYVESKGHECAVWRIKRRLFKYYGDSYLQIWKGSHTNPYLHETVVANEE